MKRLIYINLQCDVLRCANGQLWERLASIIGVKTGHVEHGVTTQRQRAKRLIVSKLSDCSIKSVHVLFFHEPICVCCHAVTGNGHCSGGPFCIKSHW